MSRLGKIVGLIIFSGSALVRLHATGYYGPSLYFDNGGENVDASPEFYWGLEVRRLAREFHPPEKLVSPKKQEAKSEDEETTNYGEQDTDAADEKDFDSALQEGRIKPPDPAKAKQQHKAARETVTDASSDPEFDSEFADYHRGARAYRNKQWDDARKAWEDLLKRPEQERHYRTVWAAFMLGKVGLKTGDFASAAQWFQRTREFAAAGFADSLGLAADSYGWEGRSEWKQDHPEKAAPLFLSQLALGDASAVVSLKALVPDREPVEGMLNYGPEDAADSTDEKKREEEQKEIGKLKIAAQDPVLRRLVTVHILATAVSPDLYQDQSTQAPVNRCARWLKIIKQANISRVEDAEYLGWVAYNNGDYKGAAHWLEFSKPDSTATLWLKAKLQRRAGKMTDAANSMAQALELMKNSPAYTPPGGQDEQWTQYDVSPDSPHWGFGQSASGDLAGLRLARADFVQALDSLLNGHLWEDAAFVAERVLTTNELKTYTDTQPVHTAGKSGDEDYNAKLRYLLGRRLVREDRYAEALPYLPPPSSKILEKYAAALKAGANEKLSKDDRAHAWFTAAWLARYDGMELMGTEDAPDGFAEDGEFPMPDLAQQRRSGFYEKVSYTKDGDEKKTKVPISLKPTKQELQRLAVNKINPDLRFHYRIIAGALAIKAAELLPTDSEELADVVNAAGTWVKDRDEKLGDRYMHIIEQRCAGTEIGRAAIAKHWFVDQNGPWSTAEQEAYDALHKELTPENSGQ
jgi:hypothetical protein